MVRGLWLIFVILAIFPLSYYGAFGGQLTPSINFTRNTLIVVGIKEIVTRARNAPAEGSVPLTGRPGILPGIAAS